jgi:hypothetical protein
VRGLALLLSACGAVAAYLLWRSLAEQIPLPADGASVAGRLSLVLLWLLPSAMVLWSMLLVQMGVRFITGSFDPLAGGQPTFLAINQRIITNTVEHGAVFALAMLALAANAPSRVMPQVLALAVVFAVARLAFWAGYLVAPVGRAPGMAATVAATIGAIGGALWVWIVI